MYTLHNAARFLGVSTKTVREWMARDGIEITLIKTDRKRIYIAYDDVVAMADKHRPPKVDLVEQVKSARALSGLYSIADVASLLGVKYETIRRWLRQSGIQKKLVTTDKTRVYISYTDIVTLAELHNRTINYDNLTTQQDGNAQADNPSQADHNTQDDNPSQANNPSQDDQLYTISDAALFLGVTEFTVRNWLSVCNIEKKNLAHDKKRVYISHSDILTLSSKIKPKSTYHVNIVADIREIKSRIVKIEAGILNLENYIKRSIFIGK